MAKIFSYRYVPFGTVFASAQGVRPEGASEPSLLYQNELVVDVGGVCWGFEGEKRSVLDHHFVRKTGGQFPSAAAAVLHNAQRIWDKFGETARDQDTIWLVTHHDTDFDAFCAMYLARRILEGADSREKIPKDGWEDFGVASDGWLGESRINWYKPDLGKLSIYPERRWAVLLAAYAACVDNCKPLSVPRQRALHSILYAALGRGRSYLREDNGAIEFFREVERIIAEAGLNPLFDSVLEDSPTFAPELAMLDREVQNYQRDIKRSRRALVYVPKASRPFDDWFQPVKTAPLFEDGTLNAKQLEPVGEREQVDGCYLRDPECLLFKEWVRKDIENSSMGQGFLFTAIAYSNGRPQAAINTTNYFFALDPDRADGRHLYNVWVRLQVEEINALLHNPNPKLAAIKQQLDQAEEHAKRCAERKTRCRERFEDRAGDFKAYFNDPWFDGNNYGCTIVATPNRGTFIGAARRGESDLNDDPVAALVRRELEFTIYGGNVIVYDFPSEQPKSVEVSQVDVTGATATGMPTDFLDRHLLVNVDWVGVWSRRGAAIAYKTEGSQAVRQFQHQFRQFARLRQGVESIVRPPSETAKRIEATTAGCLRFAKVKLHDDVNVLHGAMAEQIGRMLWRILHEESKTDEEITGRISPLTSEAARLRSENHPKNGDIIDRIEPLMRDAARVRHDLALPENQLPSRFFEATQLGEVLATVRDVATARNISIVARVQVMLEYIEIFIAAVSAATLWDLFANHFRDFLLDAGLAQRYAFLGPVGDFVKQYRSPGVVVCAVIGAGVAAAVLQPGRHRRRKA